MRTILALLTIILLLSAFVAAAGGGSGGTPRLPPQPQPLLTCEQLTTMNERVSCRLAKGTPGNETPEACRGLSVKTECVNLYRDIQPCYKINGVAKDRCFQQVSGFQRGLGRDAAHNKTAVRNYVVAVLYDLEERVEQGYDDGKISAATASEIINNIIFVKQKLLSGKPASEIKKDMDQLKATWRQDMP